MSFRDENIFVLGSTYNIVDLFTNLFFNAICLIHIYDFPFQDTALEKIDFTKLSLTLTTPLTSANLHLRRDMYITWANSTDIYSMFWTVMKQMIAFSKNYCLEYDGKQMLDEDILYSLLKCKNFKGDDNTEIVLVEISRMEILCWIGVYISNCRGHGRSIKLSNIRWCCIFQV